MSSKDTEQKTKTSLMDELKSIKGVLNTDDDNVPLLLDDNLSHNDSNADDDIPVLANDDDIPVLTSPDSTAVNRASLDDAIRQLESMELSPKSNKSRADESKFDSKATTVRENPFITPKNTTDRFAESRKQAEEALKSVISHSRAVQQSARPAPAAAKETPAQKPHEYSADASSKAEPTKSVADSADEEENAAAEILKLLGEDNNAGDNNSDFGELIDIEVPTVTTAVAHKKTDTLADTVIDEVIEEYMVVLEAALRKKLKAKLSDLSNPPLSKK